MHYELEAGTVTGVHSRLRCQGETCTIHNRSRHRFRHAPQVFNNADRHMYRVCPHLNFYLDPDESTVPSEYRAPICCGEESNV